MIAVIPQSDVKQWMIALLACTLLYSCAQKEAAHFDLPDTVDFNDDVRPILSQNCYLCHGPDPSSRKADLRLDTYEGATAALKNGKAIVPHDASSSLLIKRVSSNDPDYRMPPPEAKKTLTKKEIAIIHKWIDQGAEWKEHWAFIKPIVSQEGFGESGIDDRSTAEQIDIYVDRQLARQKLQPSGTAAHHQLIRRVAYLITGLPPSVGELERFSNNANDTYEEMVDYYLASPRYGERWARHWMDLVRYAEHRGHEFDYTINGAYLYRDYLIRAFNMDVPYDQLVKEHLAGDLMETPRLHPTAGYNESIIATAYANLGEGKHSPVSIKEEEATRIDNMIDVTSKTFQALTVSCARCHDHKFDPIPTTDYYAMYGMFESTRFGSHALVDQRIIKKATRSILEQKEQAKNSIAQLLSAHPSPISLPQSDVVKHVSGGPTASSDKSGYRVIGDFTNGRWDGWDTEGLAFGERPLNSNLSLDLASDQIEIIPPGASSRAITKGLSGSLQSPNFIIKRDTISVLARGHGSTIRIIADNFHLIQDPLYGSLSKRVESDDFKYYNLDVAMLKGHKAYIEILPGHYNQHQYHLSASAYVDVQHVSTFNALSEVSDADIDTEDKEEPISMTDQKDAMSAWQGGQASYRDIEILNARIKANRHHIVKTPDVQSAQETITQLIDDIRGAPMIHTMSDGDAVLSPVFVRGSYQKLSNEQVPHGFLHATQLDMSGYPQDGSGRLAWAEAVLHPDNPLTSRVMANRIWHHIFGRGIVETVDNFGLQGKLPTHPELLDYLAISFVNDKWSIKKLIKNILMTKAFRKSTASSAENLRSDPDNLYLHHYPIRRLEAEAIRDGILASSQRLDTTIYGPPIPLHLTEFMTGRGRPRQSGPLDGDGRRSIYTSIRRNFLPPLMLTFDMPIPFSSFGRRNTTNVPAQSLALMNDPFVQEQARRWAEYIVSDTSTTVAERIEHIYLTAFARKPSDVESGEALQLLEELAGGSIADERVIHDIELWQHFCHTIYNLKEFIHLM